jgi:hypothetical protein
MRARDVAHARAKLCSEQEEDIFLVLNLSLGLFQRRQQPLSGFGLGVDRGPINLDGRR